MEITLLNDSVRLLKSTSLSLTLLLLCSTAGFAQRGHSSGSYSSHSSSRSYSSRSYSSPSRSSRSYSSHSSTSKPVHVGTYTRRNGTTVHSYNRSSPGTAQRHTSASHTYQSRTSAVPVPRTHYSTAQN